MMRLVAGVALAIAVVLAATASAGSAATPVQIVVTRDALALPSGCTARGVADLFARFFDAVDQGNAAEIDRLVAPAGLGPPAFMLFSIDRTVVYERDRLVSYLLGLRSQGERFRLIASSVEGTGRSAPSSVSVNFRVERPKGMYVGKGLIDCTTQRIWQGAIGAQVSGTLALVLPCPRPPGWSLMGPVVACTTGPNASALSSTFSVARAGVALPLPCIPSRVQSNVRALLTSFNNGLGGALAQRFVARGRFHPYTGSLIGGGLIGRRAVASFVRTRYNAGDGWTASRLAPPQGPAGLPDHAVYGLMFAVTYQGTLVAAEAAAKLVVDCRSGLLRRWVGPSIKIPGS